LKKPHFHGHRDRLKDRFRKNGSDALADYEVLEMLLYFVNARGDTKPIAKELLNRFSNLMNILEADEARLQEIEDIGPQASLLIKVVQALLQRANRQKIIKKPVFLYWEEVLAYLQHAQGYAMNEQLRLLFVNVRNELIREELHQWGTVNQVPLYPREIIKRAIELGASGVILVHNHPCGEAKPTKEDKDLTKTVQAAGELMNIHVLDHIIVAKNQVYSFRQNNLL
jgi:DNA repair protein RadC